MAAVAGSAAYVLWSGPAQTAENIRIGICADLDMAGGKAMWRGAILAAEQVNAEGGVLGRNLTIVAEDDDTETPPYDISVATNALSRLITVDKADFVISCAAFTGAFYSDQDICADHKIIMFGVTGALNNYTQRVLDNYDRYKYFFKFYPTNDTVTAIGMPAGIIAMASHTNFTKIALLFQDSPSSKQIMAGLKSSLPAHGLDIVYSNLIPATTTDFTSYFAAAEAADTEILVPIIGTQAAVNFVKEWHDRQSPCIVLGVMVYASTPTFWDLTEGKCEYLYFSSTPIMAGYPQTNKTLSTREAYRERWGNPMSSGYVAALYDGVRYILPDALKRAGTTETETVIKALETVNVETSLARHFVFTSSHDIMVGAGSVNNPAEDYFVVCIFQYQANKTIVPIRPEEFMKEANATYQYPPWEGPWTNKQTP